MKQEIEEQKEAKVEVKQESDGVRTEMRQCKKSPFEIDGNLHENGLMVFWLVVNNEYLGETKSIYEEV